MSSVQVEHAEHPLRLATPIGKAYSVSVDYFIGSVLPPLHEALRAKTETPLKAFPNALTKKVKLYGYSDNKTPSSTHWQDVDKAFLHLARDIRSAVGSVKNTVKKLKPKLVFRNNKEGESDLEQRNESYLPDAYFVPLSAKPNSVHWTDIAVLAEYKRENDEDSVQENINKMARSLELIMRDDPRRRFVYGFTVEDTDMKFWYCDRSQVVVSRPFNCVEDPTRLFKFVLSLTFAEPHMLGWDPTMTRIDVDGQVQYDITVHPADSEPVIYRTLEVLFDSGASNALGRGTRVWKAVKIEDGNAVGDPVALKDAWVDGNRRREGDIYFQVMASDFLNKEYEQLQRCLVAVQSHGDVLIDQAQDKTPTFFRSDPPSEDTHSEAHQSSHSSTARPAAVNLGVHFQVHYRIVYKEVGESLAEATSLRTVFKALTDVVFGVIAMHKSGWVHRDLSAGNILVVNGTGKITDLEYATSEIRQGKPGRTGTASFVALEVDSETYLFRPDPTITRPKTQGKSFIRKLAERNADVEKVTPPPETIYSRRDTRIHEFHYNPLHDLESLWWNALYFTVNREVDDDGEQEDSTYDRAAQLRLADELFYHGSKRLDAFMYTGFLEQRLKCLHPSLVEMTTVLLDIRDVLRDAYRRAEEAIDRITFDVAEDIYGDFRRRFQKAAKSLDNKDVKIHRFVQTMDLAVE
ncbi:hypothetical protein NM688_g2556 [Phlebia brevispora]|uniref:Uncharacterized protein n=1 Tax=Phlebia brevispora TaxID=194682 RepID=A0ACC1T887_9APHY|nr:hypothetical protein NM688_g2556 [Phlebia brevispora]